jgi:penicillin-insensitive murein endopeptidase
MRLCSIAFAGAALAFTAGGAPAQDKGSVDPKPLPPLANPSDPKAAARELFVRKTKPAALAAQAIGFYARGCLAGGVELPLTGETWQVMRVSRNRNWGHPSLVRFLERLADKSPAAGWRGLLVGDMSQPRGGPMLTGHTSHQVGLDVDIWLTPMPEREFTREEREELSATNVVAADRKDVDPKIWTPGHLGVIKAAAEDASVDRIFVNAAIKKALCRSNDSSRQWLRKVRPWWGHNYHFHVRLHCPAGNAGCEQQPDLPSGDGCGKELDWWFRDAVLFPKPPKVPPKPKPPMTMASLPAACKQVLQADDKLIGEKEQQSEAPRR